MKQSETVKKYLNARLEQFKSIVQLSKEEGTPLIDNLKKAGYTLSFHGPAIHANKGRCIVGYQRGKCVAMLTPTNE